MEAQYCSVTDKLCYKSYKHAENDARAIGDKRQQIRKKFFMSPYWCRFCNHFHVGSLPKEGSLRSKMKGSIKAKKKS